MTCQAIQACDPTAPTLTDRSLARRGGVWTPFAQLVLPSAGHGTEHALTIHVTKCVRIAEEIILDPRHSIHPNGSA